MIITIITFLLQQRPFRHLERNLLRPPASIAAVAATYPRITVKPCPLLLLLLVHWCQTLLFSDFFNKGGFVEVGILAGAGRVVRQEGLVDDIVT